MKKNNYLIIFLSFTFYTYSLSNTPDHPLFQAARKGNIDYIKQALDNYEECNITDSDGNTMLHIAAQHGHLEVVEELIKDRGWFETYFWGPSVPTMDDKNNKDETPFDCSIKSGHHTTMKAFLENKKDTTPADNDQIKALRLSTDKDDPTAIDLLHHYNYNLLLYNEDGYNTFHYAIRQDKPRVCRYLAQKQALINSKTINPKTKQPLETPLMLVVDKENIDAITFFVQCGADVNLTGPNGISPIHKAKTPPIIDCLLKNKALIDAQDNDGHTALHRNIINNNENLVKYLMEKNADIKKKNKKGESSFLLATTNATDNIYTMITQHPDCDINEKDYEGKTAVIKAAEKQYINRLQFLISANANTQLSDYNKDNALHYATKKGSISSVKLLITHDPLLLTMSNKDGNIPIMTAIQSNQIECVQFLIDKSPLDTKNNNAEMMLLLAAQLKDPALLTFLLPLFSPSDIQHQDKNGFTMLHHAIAYGGINNVNQAKNHNLSCSQRTKIGDTGVHIAAKNNRIDMLEFLEKTGENFDVLNDNKETPFVAGALSGSLEATQHLFSEKHFISQEVNLIINKLKNSSNSQQKKVYDFVKKQSDIRWNKCNKIANEYMIVNQLIAENISLAKQINHKNTTQSYQYNPLKPRYQSAEQLYNTMTHEEHTQLLNHYLTCKESALNCRITLNKALDEIRREEEKEEQRKREAEYRAQQAHIAALEQERIARNNAAALAQQLAQQQQMKPIPSAPEQPTPAPAPKQNASSDYDRSVFAKKHVELFEESLNKTKRNNTDNALLHNDVLKMEKHIKNSTLSSTTIEADDGAAHIQAGIILFLDEKLAETKVELQKLNQYHTDDLDAAIATARKDIITAIKRLKMITYVNIAELLGHNRANESSNIQERIIKNMSK